jgi:hypothetical protein
MSRRPSPFVTWGVVIIGIGLPTALACSGLAVLVWLYGFH